MNPTTRTILTTTAAMLALAGCATTPAPKTIADTAAASPELSTLNRLVAEAGLGETLRGGGPYTVFAPSDAAFNAMPKATLEALGRDKELLKSVLSYHVVPGKVMAESVRNGNVQTVQGENVALSRAGSFVTIEDALVTQPNVDASNGVVHVIDKVLMPPKKK